MDKKIEMFQTMVKTPSGSYLAVLSDDSLDRDGEIVGKSALSKIIDTHKGKVPILLNHKNKIENLVGEWINRRMEEHDGHTALVAEPKFYMSNEKAKMIKGMLDDGAECGISIGAIVKNSTVEKINGRDTTVFTELELLEASFVAIPSNRHGKAMAVAKSFMSKVNKVVNEEKTKNENLEKDFETLKSKNEELVKSEAEISKKYEEMTKKLEEQEKAHKSALEEVNKKHVDEIEAVKKELEELKNSSVMKGDFRTKEEEKDELVKAMKEGNNLPIMRQ